MLRGEQKSWKEVSSQISTTYQHSLKPCVLATSITPRLPLLLQKRPLFLIVQTALGTKRRHFPASLTASCVYVTKSPPVRRKQQCLGDSRKELRERADSAEKVPPFRPVLFLPPASTRLGQESGDSRTPRTEGDLEDGGLGLRWYSGALRALNCSLQPTVMRDITLYTSLKRLLNYC